MSIRSPQGSRFHSSGGSPQFIHYFANRPMWRNQEYIVLGD